MSNRDIEAARTFHQITAHSYTSVRTVQHSLDWENLPLQYKIYADAGTLALPRDLELSGTPALHTMGGGAPGAVAGSADIEQITRLLFCAGGLTRTIRMGNGNRHFRAAASAGALYPIEIYLAAGEVYGVQTGLYHFSPADLRLRGLRRGDWRPYIARSAGMRPSLLEARALIVLSAIFWRSTWKYRARAYRYCMWDTGTILANLLAAARAEGVDADVVTAFADAQIEALVEVDGDREGIIGLVALGRTTRARDDSPELLPLGLETIPLSASEVVYPDLVRVHEASRLYSPEEAGEISKLTAAPMPTETAGPATIPDAARAETGLSLGDTILRRGSARAFELEAIGVDELAAIMVASSDHPPVDFPRLTESYLIVNAVEGLESGAYYYRRETGAFELLKGGSFRTEGGYLCLEQPLGADCSALIVYMADLERVLALLGNRGYRDAHLEAGLLGGWAYLAAYALERGATGLTFYDEDTSKFFAPHAAGMSPLLMVAVGVPRLLTSRSV